MKLGGAESEMSGTDQMVDMRDAGLIPAILEVESARGKFRLGVVCYFRVFALASAISSSAFLSPCCMS